MCSHIIARIARALFQAIRAIRAIGAIICEPAFRALGVAVFCGTACYVLQVGYIFHFESLDKIMYEIQIKATA